MRRVLLALGLLLPACVAPPPPLQREPREPTARPAEASAHRAAAAVRVRLSGQEKKESVRIGGTPLGTIVFERDGDGVRSSEGGHAASFTVSPAPRGEGLTLAGRVYPGVLVVSPHRVRGLRVENEVDLERYVAGVVPAELVPWSALPAEIEAQAICARTYALGCLADAGAEGALWDDTRHQVYLGRFQPGGSPAARRVAQRLERALVASAGLVLLERGGGLLEVRFHASCGGYTRAATGLWRSGATAPVAVPCAPCGELAERELAAGPPDRSGNVVAWGWTASASELSRLARSLGVGDRVTGLRPESIDPYGRWSSVRVDGDGGSTVVAVSRLRAELGPDRLRSGMILSTWPRSGELVRRGLRFDGLGWGHGEGLCQLGAHEYASRGWSSEEILGHYFPEARVASLVTMEVTGTR